MYTYFRPNRFYKHDNNRDVVMYIHAAVFIPEKKEYQVKITWYKIVHELESLRITERINIKQVDVKNWKIYK